MAVQKVAVRAAWRAEKSVVQLDGTARTQSS